MVDSNAPDSNDPAKKIYCPPSTLPRSRVQINDPDLAYVHLHKVALGGAKGDVAVALPRPYNSIIIVSIDPVHQSDTLFLHFRPLYKTYVANAIIAVGNEEWLPMFSQVAAQSKLGCGYNFAKPMPLTIYFDVGQEAGGVDYEITFAVGNDLDYWNVGQ